MKRFYMLPIVMLMGFVFAGPSMAESDISANVKMTYASKYIWRGYDVWNDGGAVQPDVSVDFGGPRIYAGVWATFATDDQCIDPWGDRCTSWNEFNYYLGHYGTLFEGGRFQTDYDVNYTYFDFYKLKDPNSQEMAFKFTYPHLMPSIGSPYWATYYGWPEAGSWHSNYFKLGLESEFALSGRQFSSVVEASWDKGVDYFGSGEGTELTHIKAGLGTTAAVGVFEFEPAFYYQWAIKDGMPEALLEDELWAEISLSYSF